MFVPGLESDQVKTWWVKDFESYFDFPGPVNRVHWIFERVPNAGRPGAHRHRGASAQPIASNKPGAPKAKIVVAGDIVEDLRLVKDDGRNSASFAAPLTLPTSKCWPAANSSSQRQRDRNEILKGLGRRRRRPDGSKELTISWALTFRSSFWRSGPLRQTLGVSPCGTRAKTGSKLETL